MPRPLQAGHAPSEFALNSDAFTPLAAANALRIGSRMPVYVAGFERREPRIADWSMTVTDGSVRGRQPWISELLPEPATPVTATSTPSGTSTETSFRLCSRAFRIGIEPRGTRGSGFSSCRTSRWRPVAVPDAIRPSTGALVHDGPAVRAGARTHVDDVVGDPDHLRVVLDDQDRVALVAQAAQRGRSAGARRGRGGRSSARRRCTSRRSGSSPGGGPSASAATRRPTAWTSRGRG